MYSSGTEPGLRGGVDMSVVPGLFLLKGLQLRKWEMTGQREPKTSGRSAFPVTLKMTQDPAQAILPT